MLTLRAVSQPVTIIGQGSRFQIRSTHSLRLPHLQTLPRPNTLIAKIRFRADGKPRSKLIAMGFGSLILSNLLTLRAIFEDINILETGTSMLGGTIYVQQTDISYDSVDFDDPISTLTYFKKLSQSYSQLPEEEVDQGFDNIALIVKNRGPKHEIELQRIMRLLAEKVHLALRELTLDSRETLESLETKGGEVILNVFIAFTEAFISTMNLRDSVDDHATNLSRNRTKKDVEALDHYELIG